MNLESLSSFSGVGTTFIPGRGVHVTSDGTIYACAVVNGELLLYTFKPDGTHTCTSIAKKVVMATIDGSGHDLVFGYVDADRKVQIIYRSASGATEGPLHVGDAGAYTPGPSIALDAGGLMGELVWVKQSTGTDQPGDLYAAAFSVPSSSTGFGVNPATRVAKDVVNADVDGFWDIAYRNAKSQVVVGGGSVTYSGYDPSIDGEHIGYHFEGYAYVSGHRVGDTGNLLGEGGKFVHVADMDGSAFAAWSTYPTSKEATASKAAESNAVRGIAVAIVTDGEVERCDPTTDKGQLAIHGVAVDPSFKFGAVVWRTEPVSGTYVLHAALYTLT